MQNYSDLGHFKRKIVQINITFEQKLWFSKFKGLNWLKFYQSTNYGYKSVRFKKTIQDFWGQKTFFPVSFFRKLIVHRFLCLKLFCSSKIVDFRAYFAKFSAAQAFLTFGLPHFYNLAPPLFLTLAAGLDMVFNLYVFSNETSNDCLVKKLLGIEYKNTFFLLYLLSYDFSN